MQGYTVFFRYTYPWWREKEINSEERRAQGLCPLTPEEVALVLKALGFDKNTQIYIAAGEIYGSEHRLSVLREAFPRIVSPTSPKILNEWCSVYWHFFLAVSLSLVVIGKEGNATGVVRVAAVSEPFVSNGCSRFHGICGQQHFYSHV